MTMKHLVAFSLAVALLGAAGTARAAVIYDNGTADLQDTSVGGVPAGLNSDFDGGLQVADDFTLGAGASTITDIHWWGFYAPNPAPTALPTDNFTVRIFADSGGSPAVPVTTPLFEVNAGGAGRSATGDQVNVIDSFPTPHVVDVLDIYEYEVHIAPLALTAGTRYWLSVVNDTTADPDHDWLWSRSVMVGGPPNTLRNADTDPWVVSGNFNALFNRAFNLTDDDLVPAIPEPGSLVLLGFGLAGLGMMRRRHAT